MPHPLTRPTALALLALSTLLAAPPLAAQGRGGEPPPKFDQYWMVFLMRGENPPQLGEAESQDLQRDHLKHLEKVWRSGHALVAGPFGVPKEEPMRGIVLFRGDLTEQEVRQLAEADPAVQAGRLRVEVRQWFTGAGMLTFKTVAEVDAEAAAKRPAATPTPAPKPPG